MRRGRLVTIAAALALLAVLAGLASFPAAGAQESGPQLEVRSVDGSDPDEVGVEFLWTGDRDQVPELVVRENGEVVPSTTPVRLDEDRDFGIVLAIDTSGSMEENAAFERAVDAAKQFVAEKAASDQIAIVGFSGAVQVITPFTADVDTLTDAIDRLGLGGGTALYDAVRESVNLFEDTDLVPNVVLLTDGGDQNSETSEDVAASLLGESNALLYAIGLESESLDTGSLQRLTEVGGGELLTSSGPDELAGLYAEAQESIRQQFRATFVSESTREGPADLTLTIGATSDDASYTPGARLDSARQIEPVEVPSNGGIDALQSEVFVWVAVGLVLLATAGAAFAVGSALTSDRQGLDRVLQPYSDGFVADADADDGDDRLATSAILQRAVELTGDFAERRGVLKRVEDMLERANLPLRAAEALFFYGAGAVVLALLGAALGGIFGAIVLLVLGALIPPAVVVGMGYRRRSEFQSQLPDMLGLLASTLRAGYSLMQGVEAAVYEVADPIKRELQRVVNEARLGMPLEEALANVAVRMRSRDFEWATMAIGIQRDVGGNLAELLDTVGETMRQRERLRRDIKSLTAEGRLSAIVLGVLPIGIGVVIYVLNPEYMESLFDRSFGVVMLGTAAVLMGVGFYWMYKVVDIEV
ncbi:MAG: VWA domain-containing protein [Acidimicrobiales bacterium]|nr:VWA domain-containing protein [Acidimicrobiales bacterium]